MLRIIGGVEARKHKWPWHVAVINIYMVSVTFGKIFAIFFETGLSTLVLPSSVEINIPNCVTKFTFTLQRTRIFKHRLVLCAILVWHVHYFYSHGYGAR